MPTPGAADPPAAPADQNIVGMGAHASTTIAGGQKGRKSVAELIFLGVVRSPPGTRLLSQERERVR